MNLGINLSIRGNFSSSGADAVANIDTSYIFGGITAAGAGTVVTSSASLNTKGAWVELNASTSANIAGFYLTIHTANSSSTRHLLDIGVGAAASEVVLVPDIFVLAGTIGGGTQTIYIPMNILSGTRISARCQSSGASGSVQVVLTGEVRTADHPPLYDNCERFSSTPAGSPQATLPSSTDLAVVTTANTGWTTINASTARTYGAVLAILGLKVAATAPTTAQSVTLRIATGAAASEAVFFQLQSTVTTANPTIPRWSSFAVNKSIPSGTRVSGEVLGTTAGVADIFSAMLLGFY